MDYQPSEALTGLIGLRESVKRGDWDAAQSISAEIQRQAVPRTADGLEEYLTALKEVLVFVKTWRADAMTSLVRIKAAARFRASGDDPSAARQNSGTLANL